MAKNKSKKRKSQELRLWAEGAREIILAPHLDAYQIAKDQGRRQERKLLKKICREFHARVGWRVQDHEEPVLKEWDPNAIEDEELLSDEEQAAKTARQEELNARIRRWYTYRLRKIRKSQRSSKDVDPRKDPYAVLMANLSGVVSPPKALQAYQQFMRESYETKIAPVVVEKWAEQKRDNSRLAERSKEPKAGFRAEVAREVFAGLPDEERKAIAERAKQEAATAKAEYVDMLKAPPSQAPQARQKCIDGVADFMGPILQGLYTHTGMHATLIMGGPVPMFGGELRTLHVSYGRNLTALGPHWPQWDKARFAEVTKSMTDYLHTAYTPQDCAKAALINGVADLSNANYTINDPDDSGSDSTSDSDSSSSDDSDSDTDDEADRPAKKRKLTGTTKKSGSAHLSTTHSSVPASVSHNASSNASSDNTNNDPNHHPATADDDDRPIPYLGYHISEAERQQNIQRNQVLLHQLKSDVMGELTNLAAEFKSASKKKKSSDSARNQSRPRTTATASASATVRKRKSARLATDSSHISPTSSAAPTALPSTSSTVVLSSPPSDTPAALQSASPPPLPSAPSVPVTESSSVPAVPPSDSTPTTPPLPPLSQAAHAAITNLSLPPSAAYTPCPANAAPWFSSAYAAMTKEDLGCHYHALVAAWTRMEVASRFEFSSANLPAKHRPKEVGTWIGSSRRVEPAIEDPTQYALEWQRWWDSLQPSWRVRGGDGRWTVLEKYGAGGKEWGSLYRWGINGVLSIVASLYFWGRAVRLNPEMYATWESAVQDTVWILEGMAIYYEMFKGKF
ncbi:hypothetical protein R3P38DRAFT_2767090 [Favolaschia claudopus]|uniref:Uncharacterized protein n=1 Tax=Favolaschia claudopus TaxID=2862362 RepID=A0AAW0CY16_9AGAR